MPTEIDAANPPVAPLTLLEVLRDAAPLPWLLTGEQHETPAEGEPSVPWHVPGAWPHAVIHQFQPGPIMGRGDGFSIADGMQNEADARLVRAAREMAEAILMAARNVEAVLVVYAHESGVAATLRDTLRHLREAERAVIGPIPTAKPVQR